ncbi:MAG: hypothetical protein WBA23_19705 [Tunicatimonas sp.]|uniref:hypothetical protein n=1 Tax=Tunicatimonas sp. TaxID=1940096 RepID=UPI003C72E530
MRTVFSIICQRRYFPVYLLSVLVVLASCKNDDGGGDNSPELNAQQERAQALAGTWVSSQVAESPGDTEDAAIQELNSLQLVFGVNQTTLAPTTFSASGADTYFNSGSGASWGWGNADPDDDAITLSAVAPVAAFDITSFDGSTMTISFNFEGASTGRIAGLGAYRVQLTKQ